MPGRSAGRNVWLEFASLPGTIQGGLCASASLTKEEFVDMLKLAFVANGGFEARPYGSETPITPTNQALQHGRYILKPTVDGEEMRISDQRFHPRTASVSNSHRDGSFRRQVRARDRGCVVSGERIPPGDLEDGYWGGYQAAHIFPLALSHIFASLGYPRLITTNSPDAINSPQNGLLLCSGIHTWWDDYAISVNPRTYRVQSFRAGAWKYHGNILDPVCRQPGDPNGALQALLQWHFEQAVLANMRGAAGEPAFETDFPPGTDMIGEIQSGPYAAAQMEAELFGRLHGWDGAERATV